MKRFICFFGHIPNDGIKPKIGECDDIEDAMILVEQHRKKENSHDVDWRLSVGQIYDSEEKLLYVKQNVEEAFIWKYFPYDVNHA